VYIQYGFLYLILTGPKFAMQTRWISDNLSTPSCCICCGSYQTRWVSDNLSTPSCYICSWPYQTRWISASLSPPPAASAARQTKLAGFLTISLHPTAASVAGHTKLAGLQPLFKVEPILPLPYVGPVSDHPHPLGLLLKYSYRLLLFSCSCKEISQNVLLRSVDQ
jgi:hypothetical protein